MKKLKSVLAIFIISLFLCLPTAFAEETEDMMNQNNSIPVYENAGKNGCYKYNEETGEFDYIPYSEYDYLPSEFRTGNDEPNIDEEGIMPLYGGTGLTLVSSPSGYQTSTCLIGARFGDRVTHGTGFLINSQYLLTAAHVVYDNYDYNYGCSDHVAVYVGASGGTSKQYRLGHVVLLGGDFVAGTSYGAEGMFDDWAIVKLDSPVTVSVSYLKLRAVNSASDMSGTYTTQGYPCEPNKCGNFGSNKWNDSYMYKSTGKVSGNHPRYLPVVDGTLTIEEGQSGSPIYINGFVEAIGIANNRSYLGTYKSHLILINNWLYNCISENCS